LLAVMGAAGLAVGLAMKDSLSNIAAGMMLIVLRPFRIGDEVQIAGITGVVQQVRLFQTILTSVENHQITLPNSQITAEPITNFTANATRRIDIPVGVDYGNDIRGARAALLGFAQAHPKVLEAPAADVIVSELADSSVNLVLRVWVNTPDFASTRSDLLEAVHSGLPQAGFSIPFPQQDVHLRLPENFAALLGRAPAESNEAASTLADAQPAHGADAGHSRIDREAAHRD
jgi:small-conductance mechanosensitive channel